MTCNPAGAVTSVLVIGQVVQLVRLWGQGQHSSLQENTRRDSKHCANTTLAVEVDVSDLGFKQRCEHSECWVSRSPP